MLWTTFAPLTVAGIKSNLNRAETMDFETHLDDDVATFMRVRASKETKEAAQGFVDKGRSQRWN